MNAFNNGYRFKLSMYWGSRWKIYFSLYYAFTFEAAYAALEHYHFPVTQKRRCGWAIEELSSGDVIFELPKQRGRSPIVRESEEGG